VKEKVRGFDGRSVSRDYPESSAAANFLSEPGEPLADSLDPHVSHLLGGIATWIQTTLGHAARGLLMMIDGDR
jgi:hypothetical protein